MASTETPAKAPSHQASGAPLSEKMDDDPISTSPSQDTKLDGELDGNQSPEAKEATSVLPAKNESPEPVWAHGLQLCAIIVAVTLVVFLMLLDGTIIVAAVPRITDDFHSLNDIGWYGAAYQLGRCVKIASSESHTMIIHETDMSCLQCGLSTTYWEDIHEVQAQGMLGFPSLPFS